MDQLPYFIFLKNHRRALDILNPGKGPHVLLPSLPIWTQVVLTFLKIFTLPGPEIDDLFTPSNQGQGTASGGGTNTTTTKSSNINTIEILMDAVSGKSGQYYKPDSAQISPGTKLTWMNNDSVPHTATATDKFFDMSLVLNFLS